jgi:hypothetical protein
MSDKGLELISRRRNEKVHWRTQAVRKIFTVITAFILISALLGLFGSGPLSRVEARSGAFTADYPRFTRIDAPQHIVLNIQSPEDHVDIRVDNAYLHQFQVEGITPPPTETRLEQDHTVYIFDAQPGAVGEIKVDLRAQEYGIVSGTLTSSTGDSIFLRQIIYP